MDCIRRLLGITKAPSALELLVTEQSRALIELCRQQHETLDRIVAARYDRPHPVQQPKEAQSSMPPFMMSDQPDSAASLLTIDSDREFLERVNG